MFLVYIQYMTLYLQQLANMTLEGHRERRYFTGVAGDQGQKGELFGCANLLLLRKPGSNLTLDILKVSCTCMCMLKWGLFHQ